MTDILILLYLADVASALTTILVIIASVICIVGFIMGMSSVEEYGTFKLWKFAVPALLCFVLAAAMPSKQLLWAAAGMRAGQQVISTPLAQKAFSLLEKELDKALSK